MTSQELQPFHWQYAEIDDRHFQVRGHTLFYAVVLFAVVLLVTFLILYARWACRYETSHGSANALVPQPPPGLDAIVIDKLPIVLHGGSPSEVEEPSECSICLGVFEDGEKVKVLPRCGHRYHSACIDQWLRTRLVCPLCRAPLRVDSAGP